MTEPTIPIITSVAERRQIARVLPFSADLAPYIDWSAVGHQARALGAHVEARLAADRGCTVTLFWTEPSAEAVDPTLHAIKEALRGEWTFATCEHIAELLRGVGIPVADGPITEAAG